MFGTYKEVETKLSDQIVLCICIFLFLARSCCTLFCCASSCLLRMSDLLRTLYKRLKLKCDDDFKKFEV